jgi:KipI family sensor histidine kinase inhibitor
VTPPARLRPVGERALSVEIGEGPDAAASERVRALDAALRGEPPPGLLETVPGLRALLAVFDPARTSADEVGAWAVARLSVAAGPAAPPARHEIPVHYGGEDGPDLDDVAARCGLAPAEVIARHGAREYTALMLGFMPGFAYLGSLAPELHVPRRATPRTRVPAGSVAIAAGQTAVYPAATPGGWHLIGRTTVPLFDPRADPPARIRPGDRVRFVAVARDGLPEPPPRPGEAVRDDGFGVEVLEAGLLTTVQDPGRNGWRRYGVGAAGALDPRALAAANAAAGNAPGAAALECTVAGPALRFRAAAFFAVAGADLGAVLHRADLGAWRVPLGARVRARPGNVLSFEGRREGCRAYVAFGGGLDVPVVLGSRATDLPGGFGGHAGRALREGDVLPLARPVGDAASARATPLTAPAGEATTLRVVLGPQDDFFTGDALRTLFASEYVVRETSDRVGCRLEGPALAHRAGSEIASEGMLPGCIQVPPDGLPIVMGADGPTTGGYPKIATVIQADRSALAQLVPGVSRVRFAAVTVEEAVAAIIAG